MSFGSDESGNNVNFLSPIMEFDQLKEFFNSENWANSVPPDSIGDDKDESQLIFRANYFLDRIYDLKGLDFLHFGATDPYLTLEAKKRGANICDLYTDLDLEPNSEINVIKDKKDLGKYDVILILDYLEHCDTPVKENLNLIKSCRKSNGPIYLRCHPFHSPHHDHNYKHVNKIFTHLALTQEERDKLNIKTTVKVCTELKSLNDYLQMFKECELKVIEHSEVLFDTNFKIFQTSEINRRITENNKVTLSNPIIQYIDFIIA